MKKIISIVAVLLILISLVGCSDNEELISNDGRSISSVDITQEEELVYDINTRIVYLRQRTYGAYEVYTLYLSENGLPYKYVNGKLVEVVPF